MIVALGGALALTRSEIIMSLHSPDILVQFMVLVSKVLLSNNTTKRKLCD